MGHFVGRLEEEGQVRTFSRRTGGLRSSFFPGLWSHFSGTSRMTGSAGQNLYQLSGKVEGRFYDSAGLDAYQEITLAIFLDADLIYEQPLSPENFTVHRDRFAIPLEEAIAVSPPQTMVIKLIATDAYGLIHHSYAEVAALNQHGFDWEATPDYAEVAALNQHGFDWEATPDYSEQTVVFDKAGNLLYCPEDMPEHLVSFHH